MEIEKTPSLLLKDLLIVTFKRKTQILVFFGATVCIAAIASFIAPSIYEAKAQILVKTGREDIYVPILPKGSVSTSPIRRSSLEQINGEIVILKSRFLAERVIESLGPAVIYEDLNSAGQELVNKAVTRFQQSLTIKGIGESNVINISFKHTSPPLAATVVNTLVNLYLERHLEVHKTPQPEAFFNMQVGTLNRAAKLAEENLEAFKNKHEITSLEEERKLLLHNEADLRTALIRTESEQAGLEKRILELQDLARTHDTIPMDDRTMSDLPFLRLLQARLIELELQENELLTKYTDQSRLVQRVREESTIVQRELAEQKGVIILQEALRIKVDLKALKAEGKSQRAYLGEYQKRQEKLNRIEMQLNRLREEVKVQRENYRLYLTKFEQARISEAMDKEKIANVRMIEPAHVPITPVSPNKRLNIAVAIFLGGFGGLGLAIFSEYLADSLDKDEDVENLLHLPVLASIPQLDR